MLLSTSISSLIRSKGSKKSQLVTLRSDATIRTALVTFIEQDISAIPIRDGNLNGDAAFLGMLNVTDVLSYILKDSPESFYKQDISTLLNRSLRVVMERCGIRKVKIIQDRISLRSLLFNHWTNACPLDGKEIDTKHLIVNCGHGIYDVITPTDFLRYSLLLSRESGYLRSTKASDIPCGFEIKDDSKVIHGEDDAWTAFNKLLETQPFYILGVVNREFGTLEANLSAVDFLPSLASINSSGNSVSLEEAISMLRRPGLSLYAFVRATRPITVQRDLDPIVLQPHFTLADLIEKMAKMKIHQLWRVSHDRNRTPIGIVGINDVNQYFCKIFEPFCNEATYHIEQ
ncbi:hypothetical protein C9890_0378 [Perkinsus sp. BL_2016]|nr:hypothetical protein C9890_0378 [Perkinsus sp. BL_2016]